MTPPPTATLPLTLASEIASYIDALSRSDEAFAHIVRGWGDQCGQDADGLLRRGRYGVALLVRLRECGVKVVEEDQLT